jgi:toxin ParE1/3/4
MPDVPAEYRLSPEAERDMEIIWLYTLDQWGLDQTNRYTDGLTAAFSQLAENPRLGATSEEFRKGYRRNRVGRHTIYYRITDYRPLRFP